MSSQTDTIGQLQLIQNTKTQSIESMRNETKEIQVQNIQLVNEIEISKLKIDSMVEKARGLERRNLELNRKVTELASNIREVKNSRIKNLTTFETEMNNLKSRMLKLELDPTDKNFIISQEGELSNEPSEENISEDEKEAILKMFKEERDKLANILQTLHEKKEQLEAEVQKLST